MRFSAFVVACVLAGSIARASAQEPGQVGLTMGYPASAGLLWHVTDSVAIRPEVHFAFSSTETDSSVAGISTDGHSNSIGTGVTALFYLRRWDQVRTYVAPRFAYSRTSTESASTLDNTPVEVTLSGLAVSGLFGAQYTPHPRFGIFGEIGLEYANRETSSDASRLRIESNGLGTQAGVGVIFYFGGS